MSLPTLDDLKTHINVTTTTNDAELTDVLYAAIDVVEGIVGPLRDQDVTETHYGLATDKLVLRQSPVTALTGISFHHYVQGAYLPSDFLVDPAAGVVTFLTRARFYGDVTVSYTTGRATLPPAVRLATVIVGKHLWDTQRPASASRTAGADAPSGGMEYGFSPGIPDRAKILLEPFARGPRVA